MILKIKNSFSFLVFHFFLLMVYTLSAQKSGPNQQDFLEEIFELEVQRNQSDSLVIWQERILMHIDKPVINEGSPLFFKAYTLTGPKRVRASQSKVLKVELLNQSNGIIATQYHRIENGMSIGAFLIPKKLEKGVYRLRAYTRWMQNYGETFYTTKKLVLGTYENENLIMDDDKKMVEVSFYPEGGNLVSGLNNRLLIKATTKFGTPVDLIGNIIDDSGNKIVSTVPYENGMMSVIFVPSSGEEYSLETTDGNLFKLPKVQDIGYILNVNNLNSALLRVQIQASQYTTNKAIWIRAEMAGVTYLNKKIELKSSEAKLEISKEGIPFGIMDISLVDENEKILSRRPVFIDANKNLTLSILPLNTNKNELAYKIRVTDKNGKPIPTEVSFSVTNLIHQNQSGIIRENNDFIWDIDDAAKNTEKVERFIKDLELLTNEKNKEFDYQSLPNKIKYPFQKGLDLFGYAYDLNNKLLKNTKVQMLSNSDASLIIRELKTDNSGRIRIENLQLVGKNKLIFRTEGDDTKSRLVKLVPIQNSYDKDHKPKSVLAYKTPKNRETIQTSPWEPIKDNDLVELNEVIVSETKIQRKRAMLATYGMKAIKTKTAVQDIERPKFLFQLLSEIPGLIVTGSLESPSVGLISNSNSLTNSRSDVTNILDQKGPLWVIDGLAVENFPGINPTWGLNFQDIDRIELLNSSDWSMYGSRGSNGVMMIYTRNGSDFDYVNRKEGYINFQGYNESLSFDRYSETLSKRPKKYEDKATTLFWNPSVKTDENGEAIVRFISPVAYDNLEIKVSTVTKNGEVASTKAIF